MNRANRPRLSRISGSSYDSRLMSRAGDGSTLTLDFTTGQLDPRLTFTRAANTATVINSSGLVQTVNADVPRFDHDPTTLAPRGLLIEGTATNLALYSQSFTGGISWFFGGIGTKSTTNNYATAPDGTTTAARLQLGLNCALKQIAGTTGVNHTVSIWVKSNTGSNQTIAFWTGTAAANRTATTSWTRIEAVVNNASAALFDLYNPNASDCDILIWGAQLEAGSGASSYIPTGASQVQRLADICYMANADYGFSTSGGTYLAEWHRGSIITAGSSGTNALATDYASGRWLGIYTTGASSTGTAGSWSGYLNSSGAVAGINKMAVSYSSWVASASGNTSLNGGAIVSGTLTLGTTPTYLFIGAASGTAPYSGGGYRDPLNNCVRRIKYWPIALSNAQLQALTT